MSMKALSARRLATLNAAQLSYPAGLDIDQPGPGWTSFQESALLQRNDFETLTAELLGWQVHERAGLRLAVSDVPLQLGSVVEMRMRVGPVPVRAPCRVVEITAEWDRRGFSYGTLPGHPEVGMERFELRRASDGTVTFQITAISRPASVVGFVAGSIHRRIQRQITERYLQALQ
ncbi:DUF1990 family protein [Calidifontibacter terrae]